MHSRFNSYTDETLASMAQKGDSQAEECLIRRYMDETVLITVPFAKCIDLKGYKYSSIVNVYRTEGFTGDVMASTSTSEVDPMYAQQ